MKNHFHLLAFVFLTTLNINAQAAVRYVDLNSTNPVPPYSNWLTAATNIQVAIDAANPGDVVLVTNGLYATGGRQWNQYDATNRILLTNAVTVQSVNGPAVTTIQGNRVSSITNLTNAVRCAYLGAGAVLAGFTLTNGSAGNGNYDNGGGVAGVTLGTMVSNCVLAGNYALGSGGGAMGCTLINCVFSNNFAEGGGAAINSSLINCQIINNTAGWAGGALGGAATNCLFAGNHATNYGGASGFCTLVNCTLTANWLQPGGGGNGGGSYYGTLLNCIVYSNAAPNGSNWYSSSMNYCCTAPLAAGSGNITNSPLFVNQTNGDFHLQSNSPCINAGKNASAAGNADLDGNPRLQGGTVDLGAFEFQNPASVISYAWLQQYGLPTDGTADYADTDNDGMNNWQEWISGTDPTNPLSCFKMLSPSNNISGAAITWISVGGKTYFLQRGTNLATQPSFSTIQSNIAGQTGTTTFTDLTATNFPLYFYRVGVQQ
jgi:hypothetical protein